MTPSILATLKTEIYPKFIFNYFGKFRINAFGKLWVQQLRYPANIPPILRPILKKYPAYPASTPLVLIKTIPRRPCRFEKNTPPRRANKIMRFNYNS
jgi:hypothetical protein